MTFRTALIGLAGLLTVVVIAAGLFVGRSYPKVTACEDELIILCTQLELYKRERGEYPSSEEGLTALIRPVSAPFHQLLVEIPLDPWNRAYRYTKPGRKNPESFDLYSFGPDGRESNDDVYPPPDAR